MLNIKSVKFIEPLFSRKPRPCRSVDETSVSVLTNTSFHLSSVGVSIGHENCIRVLETRLGETEVSANFG